MQDRTAKALKNMADSVGIECEIYENYSGRGMFGKKTTGITIGSRTDLMICAVQLAYEIGQTEVMERLPVVTSETPDKSDEPYNINELLDELQSLRQDNMGRDLIFY